MKVKPNEHLFQGNQLHCMKKQREREGDNGGN